MDRAKVTFEYEAEDETNITIAVGDVVVVSDKSDADWWEGHVEGKPDKVGFFPASFVEMLEGGGSAPGSPASAASATGSSEAGATTALGGVAPAGGVVAKVLFDYEAADDNDLTLTAGMEVELKDTTDADWWSGSPRSRPDQVGFFPASFVEKVEDANKLVFKQLTDSLKTSQVTEVDLSSCGIGVVALGHLSDWVRDATAALTEVDVRGNKGLDKAAVDALRAAAPEACKILADY